MKSLNTLPQKKARQQFVYWGAITLSILLIALTSYYLQTIPQNIARQAKQILEQTNTDPTLIQDIVKTDGRTLILRGEIEPNTLTQQQLTQLKNIQGIKTLNNQIQEQPKPSADIHISHQNNHINLSGRIAGDDLDPLINAIQTAYPNASLRDTLKIDDALGHPLWLNHANKLLTDLNMLDQFTLSGWRDALFINGTANNQHTVQTLKYTLPITLPNTIHLDYQVKTKPKQNQPTLALISGWNGTALSATLPNDTLGQQFTKYLTTHKTDTNATTSLNTDPTLNHPTTLDQLPSLLPALTKVHDLRLETNQHGYILWGRVDNPTHLGQITRAIKQNGLSSAINNQIFIDPATRQPELSLFRDYDRIVLTGILPSQSIQQTIKTTLTEQLNIRQIQDYTRIEPNIAHAPWLEQWHTLLPQLPKHIFGLTIAEGKIFLSGQVPNQDTLQLLTTTLNTLFDPKSQINWLTTATP